VILFCSIYWGKYERYFPKLRENKLFGIFLMSIVFTLSSPCYFPKAIFCSLQTCLADQLALAVKIRGGEIALVDSKSGKNVSFIVRDKAAGAECCCLWTTPSKSHSPERHDKLKARLQGRIVGRILKVSHAMLILTQCCA
jgi:hypothetical protein